MNNFFWFQSGKLKEGDKIYRNLEELSNQFDREDTFDVIKTTLDGKPCNDDPWCGIVRDKFLFSGQFDEKDELGRYMSFLYVSDKSSETEITTNVYDYLSKLGFGLHKDSLICLTNWIKHSKCKRIVAGVSVLLGAICAIALAYHLFLKD